MMWEVVRYEGKGRGGGGLMDNGPYMNIQKRQLFQTGSIKKGGDFTSRNIEKGTGENSFCDYGELSSCNTTFRNGTLLVKCLIAAIITGNRIKIPAACVAEMKQIGDLMLHETFVLRTSAVVVLLRRLSFCNFTKQIYQMSIGMKLRRLGPSEERVNY